MHVLIMGVTGSGKSTLGRMLAAALGVPFLDADDFHPPRNIARMRAGIPLDDDDRRPWLQSLANALRGHPDGCVLACSALKQAYRDALLQACPRLTIVWLDGDRRTLAARLEARTGHFMPNRLLDSQLEALEPPPDALRLDIATPERELLSQLLERLRPSGARSGA